MATAGLASNHASADTLVQQQPNNTPQSAGVGSGASNPAATAPTAASTPITTNTNTNTNSITNITTTTTASNSSSSGGDAGLGTSSSNLGDANTSANTTSTSQVSTGSGYQQPLQQHQPQHHRGPPYHQGNQYQPHQHHHQNAKYNSHPRGDNESNINHVLLITVINPHYYPISCDLIHHICSNWGKVNRIVIFKKNGVQAMVEFDNVESAKRAKTNLHGCDIYSGCCTLRIEYAKPTRLNVHKNGNDSFDYTNPTLGSGAGGGGGNQPDGTSSSSGLNDHLPVPSIGGGSGPNQHQHLYQTPPQQQQQHGHHQTQSAHRGGGLVGGRGRGIVNSGLSQIHGQQQQQPNFQTSHPHNPHLQQHSPHAKQGDAPTTGSYAMQSHTPLDAAGGPSAVALAAAAVAAQAAGGDQTAAFQQDGGFNVSRSGPPPPSGYIEPYGLATGHGGGAGAPPHATLHGSPYPRQDGGPHHHPHHPRGSAMGPGGVLGSANHNHSSFATGGIATNALMSGPGNMGSHQGTVMMVYGLQPERVNCDRLFNLFCLYGNVIKIKFLRTKEGCAMVQMGDSLAVDRCVSSLNKTTLFGNELQLSYSKQPFLHDVIQPFILPDGSPSFKEFTNNKNNRFKHPEVASKNRILPPSHVLHFFSAPFGITEDELVHLFKQTAGHEPVSLKIFTPKGDNTKSYSGLVTFRDAVEATEALVLCNHTNMPRPGAPHPYILRLCFSPPTYPGPTNPYAQAQSSQ